MNSTIERWKHISLQEMAYIRRVVINDAPAFEVRAADGTPMAVMPDLQVARAAVRQHDLEPLSVH
jgi:hypothetical protein